VYEYMQRDTPFEPDAGHAAVGKQNASLLIKRKVKQNAFLLIKRKVKQNAFLLIKRRAKRDASLEFFCRAKHLKRAPYILL